MASMTADDAALIERVPRSLRAANGIPEPEQAAARERAAALASDALADLLFTKGIRTSPLGAGWSRDIDLHLRTWPERTRLEALGWLPLDSLMRRLGIPSRGSWAAMQYGRVLASLDLHLEPPPSPVTSLISRCRRRGEVRVREVLEARVLLRSGYPLPPDDPVVSIAARVEAGLGGRDLARWQDGPAVEAPFPLPGNRIRRRLASLRSALRPRLVVAVSGVDGSGKSTLSGLVARNLEAAGIPVSRIWARPGGKKNILLDSLARTGKRLLGQDPSWGAARVAGGGPTGDLASRRGFLGWAWAMLVTLSFLLDVRRQHLRSRGVVLYDRHLLDALVQLDFVYGGVDLRLHQAVVRLGLPKPHLSVYLDVPVEVALARLARKPQEPEDIYTGQYVVRRQLERYEARRPEVGRLRRLDGGRPAEDLAATVTRWLVES